MALRSIPRPSRPLPKHHWRDRHAALDPEVDFHEIHQGLSLHEFPWDITQALSFALFRTYAVPSIGRLLDDTGQFTGACQKRYDDTVLLLEAPVSTAFSAPESKAALRRINQMHAMYDISNDDMLYVLATFVVVPKRWLDRYGWRPLIPNELRALVNYYRELGRHMAIKDIPETYQGFADLMDDYERAHFAYDDGARRVADATLELLTSFYPAAAAPLVRTFSYALMDDPLLAAFAYPGVPDRVRALSEGALRARARLLTVLPPRRRAARAIDSPRVRSYDAMPALETLGTFTPFGGCPVPHRDAEPSRATTG